MCDPPKKCIRLPKSKGPSFFFWMDWMVIYQMKYLKKHWEVYPLWAATLLACSLIPIISWSKSFTTTIDVRWTANSLPRWEMTEKPWFNLRKPVCMKYLKLDDWQPAVHLDNRYRLMRGAQMLDKDGQPTDQVGPDETEHIFKWDPDTKEVITDDDDD